VVLLKDVFEIAMEFYTGKSVKGCDTGSNQRLPFLRCFFNGKRINFIPQIRRIGK